MQEKYWGFFEKYTFFFEIIIYSKTAHEKALLWKNDLITGTACISPHVYLTMSFALIKLHIFKEIDNGPCKYAHMGDGIYSTWSLQATTFQSTTCTICFPEFFSN